jgi:hypothetical protein
MGKLVLLVLVWVLGLPGCQSRDWHQLRSDDGRFSVLIPARPSERIQTHDDTPVGPITVRMFTAQVEAGQPAYTVAYSDYPETMLERTNPKEILDRAVEAAVGNDGKLDSQKSSPLDAYPGRSVSARVPAGLEYEGRLYLVGRRLFQLSVVSPPGAGLAQARQRFFGSFKLLSPGAPPASSAATTNESKP